MGLIIKSYSLITFLLVLLEFFGNFKGIAWFLGFFFVVVVFALASEGCFLAIFQIFYHLLILIFTTSS